MTSLRSNLTGIAIALLAATVWTLVVIEVFLRSDSGRGFDRYVIGPLVLCGLTAAIHRLLRPRKHAWSVSALIAGIGALVVLAWAAG
jgi:hypothetical protein